MPPIIFTPESIEGVKDLAGAMDLVGLKNKWTLLQFECHVLYRPTEYLR